MNTNAVALPNEQGYAEFADSLCDLLEVVDNVDRSQEDGIGLDDVGVLFKAFPRLVEVYNDRKQAIAEFLDLKGDEPAKVLAIVAERTAQSTELVKAKIFPILTLLTRSYNFVSNVVTEGSALLLDWKTLFTSFKPVEPQA